MKKVFKARTLMTPLAVVESPTVVTEDGVITSIAAGGETPAGAEVVDFGENFIVPAFFDQHVHGSAGFDVMEATGTALSGVGRFLAQHGVAGYLPTTVTATMEATLASLDGLGKLIASRQRSGSSVGAAAAGIHLEGPFLSHEKRGVHSPELLLRPTVALFDRFWQASLGQIKLMTIAPELPEASEVITYASALGVRISLGHSNATAAEARAGVAAGAVSATHTFNAMRNFNQREPGVLGVVLDEGSLYAEVICDGYHVDPAVVRLFWKAKGGERSILITDGMAATGMPDGHYKLGELDVEVVDGKCMSGGAIAGSTLTMDRAVRNFSDFTGAGPGEIARLAGMNPARMLGLEDRFGEVAVGRPADFAVLDRGMLLRETVLSGELAGSSH